MAASPYAPPAASVADPVVPIPPRPRAVVNAVRCLWASAGLILITSIVGIAPVVKITKSSGMLTPVIGYVITAALIIGLFALIAVKVYAGRGWARWVYLALYLMVASLIVVSMVVRPDLWLARPRLDLAKEFIQFVLQTAPVILMFVRPSREWFAASRKQC
jgi:hypothetical protein